MVPFYVTYVGIQKNACHFVLKKRGIFFFSWIWPGSPRIVRIRLLESPCRHSWHLCLFTVRVFTKHLSAPGMCWVLKEVQRWARLRNVKSLGIVGKEVGNRQEVCMWSEVTCTETGSGNYGLLSRPRLHLAMVTQDKSHSTLNAICQMKVWARWIQSSLQGQNAVILTSQGLWLCKFSEWYKFYNPKLSPTLAVHQLHS